MSNWVDAQDNPIETPKIDGIPVDDPVWKVIGTIVGLQADVKDLRTELAKARAALAEIRSYCEGAAYSGVDHYDIGAIRRIAERGLAATTATPVPDAEALRAALEEVEKWFISKDGPLQREYDDGALCNWDDVTAEWADCLDHIQNSNVDVWTEAWRDSGAVALYRRIRRVLAAIAPGREKEAEDE